LRDTNKRLQKDNKRLFADNGNLREENTNLRVEAGKLIVRAETAEKQVRVNKKCAALKNAVISIILCVASWLFSASLSAKSYLPLCGAVACVAVVVIPLVWSAVRTMYFDKKNEEP
jgi:hypothetical protein